MRILVVTQYYYPEKFLINDLVSDLKARGHKVTVLTGLPNYPDGRFYNGYGVGSVGATFQDGVKVIRVPMIARGKNSKVQLFFNYVSFAVSATLRSLFFKRDEFDVSVVWLTSPVTAALPAVWLKWIHKLPMTIWLQDLWPECVESASSIRNSFVLRSIKKLVHFIYKKCDRIFIQSPDFKSHVLAAGVDASRTEFMPNWAGKQYVPVVFDQNLAKEAGIPSGFVVMFAGNIGDAQDFDTVLAAAKQLSAYKNIHWVFLGKGRRLEWLKQQVSKMQLTKTVHILGYKPPELMPNFFSTADVMLAVLKNNGIFTATIPSKVQSYMASGKPIIAAISGIGAKLITDSGAGLAVEAGNKDDLASAVLDMYAMNKDARKLMGRRGRQYYLNHFDQTMLIDRFEQDLWTAISQMESKKCES